MLIAHTDHQERTTDMLATAIVYTDTRPEPYLFRATLRYVEYYLLPRIEEGDPRPIEFTLTTGESATISPASIISLEVQGPDFNDTIYIR